MSINSLDPNVILQIIDKLSGNDTVIFSIINKKIWNICKKYSDIIWKNKLLKYSSVEAELLKYSVEPTTEVIGTLKSYYLGIENKKGWCYTYDEHHNKKIPKNFGSKIPENRDYFFIPGVNIPKGEIIWIFYESHDIISIDIIHSLGKTLEVSIDGLVKILKKENLYSNKLVSKIRKMDINSSLNVSHKATYINIYILKINLEDFVRV